MTQHQPLDDLHDIDAAIQKALIYHENKAIHAAKAIYESVLLRDPSHLQAMHLLGVCYYQEGDHEKALQYLFETLKRFQADPISSQHLVNPVELLSNIGNVYFTLQDLKQAQHYYLSAHDLDSQHAPTLNNLGTLAFCQKNYQKAEEFYDTVIAYHEQFTDAYINKANLKRHLKNYDDAILYYAKGLALSPQHEGATIGLSSTYLALGEITKAIHTVKKHPHHETLPTLLFQLSICYEKNLDFEQQKNCLEKYLKLEKNELVAVALCHCYLALNCFEEAKQLANTLSDARFRDTCLGTIACKMGKWEEAQTLLQSVIKKHPDLIEARLSLATLYSSMQQLDKAAEVYAYILKKLDPNHAEVHNNLGNIYYKMGDIACAIEHFQTALKINPQLTIAYSNLANALRTHRNFYGAIECTELALKINPHFLQPYLNQAMSYAALLQYQKAVDTLDHALTIFPDNPFILAYYGQLLYQLEEYAAAYAAFSSVVASISHNPSGEISFVQAQAMVYFTLIKKAINEQEQLTEFQAITETVIKEYLSSPTEILCESHIIPHLSLPQSVQEALLNTNYQLIAKGLQKSIKPCPTSYKKKEKIRLGFVSYSYATSDIGFDIQTFCHKFSQQTEVFFYQFYSAMAFQAAATLPNYHCLENIHLDDCIKRIQDDQIDILINLTPLHPLDVPALFALRAAPIQIGYYDAPLSLSNTFYDYQLVSDKQTTHYQNPVLRLPKGRLEARELEKLSLQLLPI